MAKIVLLYRSLLLWGVALECMIVGSSLSGFCERKNRRVPIFLDRLLRIWKNCETFQSSAIWLITFNDEGRAFNINVYNPKCLLQFYCAHL